MELASTADVMLAEILDLLAKIYAFQFFTVGCAAAVLVLVLLYKAIKIFL